MESLRAGLMHGARDCYVDIHHLHHVATVPCKAQEAPLPLQWLSGPSFHGQWSPSNAMKAMIDILKLPASGQGLSWNPGISQSLWSAHQGYDSLCCQSASIKSSQANPIL